MTFSCFAVPCGTFQMFEIMKDILFTEDDYREALRRFLEICDAPEDSPEAEDLEKLMYLLEVYEQENCS
jgi:hypothetical protein